MPEELHVLVKKFDEIDTRSAGRVLLELPFKDIIQIAKLTEEAINNSLGFLVILLYPGPESLLRTRRSHEGFIHELVEFNTAIIPAPI